MRDFNSHITTSSFNGGPEFGWYVTRLWRYVKTERVYEIDPKQLSYMIQWLLIDDENLDERDLERIDMANLDYPIIVHDVLGILDGNHRLAKAIKQNLTTIKTVYLYDLPKPDFGEEEYYKHFPTT